MPSKPLAPRESAPSSPDSSKSEKASERSSELNHRVDTSGILGGIDTVDDSGEAMGEVSESSGEGREKKGDGAAAGKSAAASAASLRAQLIASNPPKRQMIRDIQRKIHDEIVGLQKQERVFKRAGEYHDMARTVGKIRDLRGRLSDLFYKTAEALKRIWLEVVHGIV